MASFNSTITNAGAEALTRAVALGLELRVSRAQVGDGAPIQPPAAMTAVASPVSVDAQIGDKEYVPGTPSIMKIPIQVSNAGLLTPVWIREVGVFARDEADREFLFCYSWLSGGDSDNMLPAAKDPETADTIHLHDVVAIVTNQEDSAVVIEVSGPTAFVTAAQLEPVKHDVTDLDTRLTIVETEIATAEHFRGYYQTYAEIQALQNNRAGDYAYCAEVVPPSATANKWLYNANAGEYEDSGVPVPDQSTPASDDLPLMDGEASPGVMNRYARGDHVHPLAPPDVAINQQAYRSAGTFQFTAPKDGWYIADVQAAGGGYGPNGKGSGGGFVRARVWLNKGDIVPVTVGAPATASPGIGGASSFGSHATAHGGTYSSSTYGTLGGSSSGGFFRVDGAAGKGGGGFMSVPGSEPHGHGATAYSKSIDNGSGGYTTVTFSFPGCVIISWI